MTDLYNRAKAALEGATPGPWRAFRSAAFWEIEPGNRRGIDPYTIGDVCASDPHDTTGLQQRNSTLIALAPDLAAAFIRERDAAQALEKALRPFDGCVFEEDGDAVITPQTLTIGDWLAFSLAIAAYRAAVEAKP